MRSRINVLVLALILVLAGGLVVAYLPRVRDAAARSQCRNNLRQLGLGLESHHDSYRAYPCGTVPNDRLPPERRLSWLVGAWAYVGDGQVGLLIDRAKAWDDEGNREPRINCIDYPGDG